VNDGPQAASGELTVTLFRGDASVGSGRGEIAVPARGAIEVPVLTLFDGFLDLNHAYRFGRPTCDLVVARLSTREASAEAFFFPLGLPSARVNDVGLTVDVRVVDDEAVELHLTTRSFAQSVSIELGGWAPDDDFFHLAPGASRIVRLRRMPSAPGQKRATRGTVTPLNSEMSIDIVLGRAAT
jgi:beta-mannosidase